MALIQSSFNFDFDNSSPKSEVLPVEKKEEISQDIKPGKSSRGRMKIVDMDAAVDKIEVPEDEELFTKSYYAMGAVTEMFKVKPSLIRFWESEFSILKPKKNSKGDRYFRPQDVKNLKLIYHLLRERKYTIQGAKEFLKKNVDAEEKVNTIESLKRLRQFLSELKTNL